MNPFACRACGGQLEIGQEVQRRIKVDPKTGAIAKRPYLDVTTAQSLNCSICGERHDFQEIGGRITMRSE